MTVFNQASPEECSVFTSRLWIEHRMKAMKISKIVFPKLCILGFFPSLYAYLCRNFNTQMLTWVNKAFPYALFTYRSKEIAFLFPGIGSPLSGALLDQTIALGAETILFFGQAGIVSPDLKSNELVIPVSCFSDEGTSSHYSKNSHLAYPDSVLMNRIEKTLNQMHIPFHKGICWTTDGLYREIPSKISRMQKQGCLTVDMEASALFTIATYYHKRLAGFFITSDSIAHMTWHPASPPGKRLHLNPVELLKISLETIIESD